jgi:two-component sensor histidine kinase
METISGGLRTFIAQEDAQLAERNAAMQSYRQWLVAAILAALAAAATLAYALFTRTQKQVSALDRSRQALLLQTGALEEAVRARTAEAEEARAHAERERERVEALLQDTNHRIGNSLATVSSLLALQQGRSRNDEVKAALEAAQGRVQAIASAHRRLRLGRDLETAQADEFLDAVVDDLRSTLPAGSNVDFVTEFEPIVIKARDATTIGIVLGELVTNAIKHAFDGSADGRIWTSLRRNGDGVAVLKVEDNGRGLAPNAGTDGGLGSMIIRQLATQFGGAPSYAEREGGGTSVAVTLPGLGQAS